MSVATAPGGEQQVTGASYLEFLKGLAFLKPISHEDLAAFANTVLVRNYRNGEDIVVQRQYGHAMFVLYEGAVGVSVVGREEKPIKLGTLSNKGDYFGEAALLGRGERTATVTAESANGVVLLEFEKHRFDLLCRRYPKVREQLETVYHARAIATYMRTHEYLGKLDDKTRQTLGSGAKLRMFQRNDEIVKAGDRVTDVLVVKDGVAKATRAKGAQTSILAYFNTHDVVGVSDMDVRKYTLTALGQCEVIYLPHGVFSMAMINNPEVSRHFTKDDMNRQEAFGQMGAANHTVFGAMEKLLGAGVEVESLLIINLDRCVRCGNCVRACHSRHKYTRLDRRGPIFKRRSDLAKAGVHEHVMMPASCRHCRDPECMIGCPTGAIQRSPSGDVDINNNCIGCENCARKCPYGNITMMPLAEDDPTKPNKETTKRAIKCNLCRDYSYSNCVHECPRGAILRVDPLRYFEELALVMEAEQREAIEYQRKLPGSKQQVKPRSTWFIPTSFILGLLLIAGVVGAALFATPGGMGAMRGGTQIGIPLGIFAAFCLYTAAFLGLRKRMRNGEKPGKTDNSHTPPKVTKPSAAIFPRGTLESWTQFHMMFGLVGFVTAAAHAGFNVTGVFTTLLMIVFALEVITGSWGQLIYMTVPKTLTRLERHGLARLVEDLIDEEGTLEKTIADLVATLPEKAWGQVRGRVTSAAGSIGQRMSKSYDPPTALETAKKNLGNPGELTEDMRGTIDRILESQIRLVDVRAQLVLHRKLRRWLIWHISTASALVVLLVFHIVTALTVF